MKRLAGRNRSENLCGVTLEGLRQMAFTFVAAGREPSGVAAAEKEEIFYRSRPDGLRRAAFVEELFETYLKLVLRKPWNYIEPRSSEDGFCRA